MHEDEDYLWPGKPTALHVGTPAELMAVYPHRADVPFDLWWHLFQSVEVQLGILVYAALFLHEQYPRLNSLLASKCKAGCKVRVLLGDPDSAAVRWRGEEETFGEGIESRCRVARQHYDPLIGMPNFELRLHQATLYNSIYWFDSQMLVNSHIWGANAYSAPVWHIRRLPRGNLFTVYAASFQSVWESGQRIDSAARTISA
ncbi:hypothetical protein [Candidatus Nephthysia bennettiae]|uniref:hypothetical protein n=1 Tax=Candidatus Nephthysia bennettiae TaxID=3127016 RepID=UPI0030C71491